MIAHIEALSDGSKAFIAKLVEANEIFRDFTPEGMNFRDPETLKAYRGLFRKTGENQWKAIFGTEADADTAMRVLELLGLTPEPCAAPQPMFGVIFAGPEGA